MVISKLRKNSIFCTVQFTSMDVTSYGLDTMLYIGDCTITYVYQRQIAWVPQMRALFKIFSNSYNDSNEKQFIQFCSVWAESISCE